MAVHKLTDFNIHIDADNAPISDVKLPKIEPFATHLENFHVTPAGWVLIWRMWAESLSSIRIKR